jgi:hypothetical protein
MKVITVTRKNVGQVARWRGERSGTHTYLQALVGGEWCQVVVTRSDPSCLPPRSLRLKAGEYVWLPGGIRGTAAESAGNTPSIDATGGTGS